MYVLNMLQQPPSGMYSSFARRAHVVTGLCEQEETFITQLINHGCAGNLQMVIFLRVKLVMPFDGRFTAILTQAKCVVIPLTYRSLGLGPLRATHVKQLRSTGGGPGRYGGGGRD